MGAHMATDPISLQQLRNASEDAIDLEHYVNDDAPALIQTRLGGQKPNYAKLVADLLVRAEAAFQTIVAFQDRGEWAPSTTYVRKDLVTHDGIVYLTLTPHTSSGSFDADLAAGLWSIYQGISRSELGAEDGATHVGYGAGNLAEFLARFSNPDSVLDGDAMLVVKQPYADSVALTQHFHNSLYLTPFHFGAVADNVADDTAALQAAIDACASARIRLRITRGLYRITEQLNVRDNLHMAFDQGAVLMPTTWASTGAFLTNVNPADAEDSEVSDVYIENFQLDGSNINLTDAGNSNGIGFARGARRIRINGASVKNLPYSFNIPGGFGGKALMVEQGVDTFYARDIWAERCGAAFGTQGRPGTFTSGVKRNAVNILVDGIHAEMCGCVVLALGITTDSTSPTGDPDIQIALVTNMTWHNVGHAPWRPVATDHKKSGIFVIGEGQNVKLGRGLGYNDPDFPQTNPGYPTDPNVIGEGLSGPIGAVIWGWGRNISAENIEHHGDVDSIVHIERARAHGDDAAPSGTPINVLRFDVQGIKHYGSAQYALTQGPGSFGPDDSMTGDISIVADVLTEGVVGSDFAGTNGVMVDVRSSANNAVLRGTAPNLRSYRNNFAGMREEIYFDTMLAREIRTDRLYRDTITIADDQVAILRPRMQHGYITINSEASLLRVEATYRCSALGAQTALAGPAVSNFAVTTGILNGTTGVDNNFTFSADAAGNLYLENRRGGPVTVSYGFRG